MNEFSTVNLPRQPDVIAPDGSDVRLLALAGRGSMAHFELGVSKVSIAVAHRTVEEVWYFLGGRGQMWRKSDQQEQIVEVERGTSLSIPQGVHFQFRTLGNEPLSAVAVTMPPWPGEQEAYAVEGKWVATPSDR